MLKILLILTLLIFSACAPQKGLKGDTGDGGPVGRPGIGLVAKSLPALTSQCPSGGLVTLIAQDNLGTGVWDAQDTQESSFVTCNGMNGINGQDGQNGTNGQDGAQVSMVQFCPQYIGTYPGRFPEFGIIVNNKLFAVYWDGHNAWMAEIYPGYYASTSSSAPCNFTVNPNGTISN